MDIPTISKSNLHPIPSCYGVEFCVVLNVPNTSIISNVLLYNYEVVSEILLQCLVQFPLAFYTRREAAGPSFYIGHLSARHTTKLHSLTPTELFTQPSSSYSMRSTACNAAMSLTLCYIAGRRFETASLDY